MCGISMCSVSCSVELLEQSLTSLLSQSHAEVLFHRRN